MNTPTVEAKLKLVVDPSGTKAVNELTGEIVAAAKAEDQLTEATKRRGKTQKSIDDEARQTIDAANRRRAVIARQREMGYDASGNPIVPKPVKPALTTADYAQEVASRARQRREIEAELRRQGLDASGNALVGKRITTPADEARELAERARERREREAELRRLGLDASGNPLGPVVARRANTVENKISDVMRRRQEAESFRDAMAARGLDPSGNPLQAVKASFKPGTMAYYQDMAGQMITNRLGITGPMAAGAAGVAGAVHMGQVVQDYARIDATPFMTERQRSEAKWRNAPFMGGRVYGYAMDTYMAATGATERMGKDRQWTQEGIVEQQMLSQQRGQTTSFEAQMRTASLRAEAMSGLKLDRPAGYDRSTAEGARQYQEEARLLPLRQKLTVLARERAAAEKDAAIATDIEEKKKRAHLDAEQRLKSVQRERREESKTGSDAAGRVGRFVAFGPLGGLIFGADSMGNTGEREARLFGDSAVRGTEADGRGRELESASRDANAANMRAAQIRAQEGQARLQLAQAEYDIAQDREGRAKGGARALARMGIMGREMAKQGLQMINQGVPVDLIPKDYLAAAEMAAPDKVDEYLTKQGEPFKPGLSPLAKDELGLQPLNKARERTDQARENAIRAEEDEIKRAAQDMSEVTKKFGEAMIKLTNILTDVTRAVDKLQDDMGMAHNNGAQ